MPTSTSACISAAAACSSEGVKGPACISCNSEDVKPPLELALERRAWGWAQENEVSGEVPARAIMNRFMPGGQESSGVGSSALDDSYRLSVTIQSSWGENKPDCKFGGGLGAQRQRASRLAVNVT